MQADGTTTEVAKIASPVMAIYKRSTKDFYAVHLGCVETLDKERRGWIMRVELNGIIELRQIFD